jgi:hypothetical protein
MSKATHFECYYFVTIRDCEFEAAGAFGENANVCHGCRPSPGALGTGRDCAT